MPRGTVSMHHSNKPLLCERGTTWCDVLLRSGVVCCCVAVVLRGGVVCFCVIVVLRGGVALCGVMVLCGVVCSNAMW